jgi:hypothetical protein
MRVRHRSYADIQLANIQVCLTGKLVAHLSRVNAEPSTAEKD